MKTDCSGHSSVLGVPGDGAHESVEVHAWLCVLVWVSLALAGLQVAQSQSVSIDVDPKALEWPEMKPVAKPWTYWHWLGSAVDKTNLTKELERYHTAGLGGVHVIPVYGARGSETNYIEFLSPRWLEMFRHVVSETQRLGMGVDMTTGTGWNFGGPSVAKTESCLRPEIKTFKPGTAESPPAQLDTTNLLAVIARHPDGNVVDLTDRIPSDGRFDWGTIPANSSVQIVTARAAYLAVKRAAPGGAGYMLNPFYMRAVSNYLSHFSRAMPDSFPVQPRAMYHDSFEYAGASWSPDIYDEFVKRRGYRLEQHRVSLWCDNPNETDQRVRTDFRETLSDMLLDSFIRQWVNWAHARGCLTRNQAHGSPGNILDLYAAADIPETEMFHTDRDILISKFASSAAHIAGRRLVAAETGTWLAEHFNVTLADLKCLADDMFLAGVNHVFYHGTTYSPDEAGWPGWLFYASTQMNPRNSIWRDVPALNTYIARCQSVFQSGASDNDLLVYWPIHDLWHQQKPLVQQLTVHRRSWFDEQPIGQVGRLLWKLGYSFDYVSDRMLKGAEVKEPMIKLPGAEYKAVVVPRCGMMPLDTMAKLLALVEQGATAIFEFDLPRDVPGWHKLDERREELRKLLSGLSMHDTTDVSVRESLFGKGRVLVGNIEPALRIAGLRREAMTDRQGIRYIRRKAESGHHYFIVNTGPDVFDAWLPLAVEAKSAALLDPMTGRTGMAQIRTTASNCPEVYVQLQPSGSIIIRTFEERAVSGPFWTYVRTVGEPVLLGGEWDVTFISGGPELPAPLKTQRLESWTTFGGKTTERFAGTARYTLRFDAPVSSTNLILDLGRVCDSARIRLNGLDLGILILPPYRVLVEKLKQKDNVIEVEVTNLSANRIRDLDQCGVKWKNFHDINFVTINYQPFDASGWAVRESGLLGPVTFQPAMPLFE